MTFLKNLAVSLFSFLLFLSLTVFGVAFAVKATALNPDFITTELNKLDIAATVKELVQIQPPAEIPNLNEQINQTLIAIQPQFKQQSDIAIHSVYAYLLGQSQTPNLKSLLRTTYPSTDFVTPLVDSVDVASLAGPFLTQQISNNILPVRIPNLESYVDQALTATEPDLKQQTITASGPIFDYLLGQSQTLNTSISLIQVDNSLKNTLRQTFITSPPAGLTVGGILLASIPQSQRGADFDIFYPAIASGIPTTYTIDQSVITPQMRTDIAHGISTQEVRLGTARTYVAMFQQYYTWLIILMAILVLGIVLIVRNVKDILHRLGVPLLTYGAMEYAGVWVIKYLISSGRMQLPSISPHLDPWLLQLVIDSMKPVEIFSLALLIAGAALTVFSFIYKPKQDLKWS